MSPTNQATPLGDHVDVRILAERVDKSSDRNRIVELSSDHPGYGDGEYRRRRNEIARIAFQYEPGQVIPDAPYSSEEHSVWQTIWEALRPAHQRNACREYLSCLKSLDLRTDRIPQLREVNTKVQALSGFRLEPVAGLVEPRVFLESLAQGVFLCTQYIMHHSTPLYTPEPDVAHEIIGHAVTLANPQLAELNRLFGATVRRTVSADALNRLARAYWFTIEFGVLREGSSLKAYGTGLLSSAGELDEMHKAELLPLDLEKASLTEYDSTHYQARLFCADSFNHMFERVRDFLVSF
jgi:phenylalanine-4-hydroxylase